MSRKSLQAVINQENFFAKFRKTPEMDIDALTEGNANTLYNSIECSLSPENLHCDGEISRAQAMVKYRMYMGAVKELKKMNFTVPSDCYEIE